MHVKFQLVAILRLYWNFVSLAKQNQKMKNVFLLAVTFISFFSNAQTNVYLEFPAKVAGNDLTLNTVVQHSNGVDMSIDFFNYYISNVHIIHDGGQDLDLYQKFSS